MDWLSTYVPAMLAVWYPGLDAVASGVEAGYSFFFRQR